MQKAIIFSMAIFALVTTSAMAADKVVVIPIGAEAGRTHQLLSDVETGSLSITSYNQDISTDMSLNVQGRGNNIMITASVNVNNTVDQSSPHDTSLTFELRFNSVVRRSETVVLKADSRHIINFQFIELDLSTATHVVEVFVNASNRVNLENRYLYIVEL